MELKAGEAVLVESMSTRMVGEELDSHLEYFCGETNLDLLFKADTEVSSNFLALNRH